MLKKLAPLTVEERTLADVAARVIVQAVDMGLPDAPAQLVSSQAICALARAHVELLDAPKAPEQPSPSFTLKQAHFLRSALTSACNGARAQGMPLNGATGFEGTADALDAEIARLEKTERPR